MKKVLIDGEAYVPESEVDARRGTDHVIVIAQRGWIFIGYRDVSATEVVRLINADNVRKWSNGRGIGALAKVEYKDEYILDHVGMVDFAPESIIATINVEW